jgi:hypothetical protein
MPNKELTLLATEKRNSRTMNLYRCCCGKEAWLRADMPSTRFKTCDCPPRPYQKATKTCTSCKLEMDVSLFFTDSRTGNPRPQCKTCHKATTDAWKAANPETAKAANSRRAKAAHAKHRFGLTAEEYQARLKACGGLCAICSKPEPQKRRRGVLSLDHCHKTGKIREALCSRCNTMLGYANDDTKLLRSAIKYLSKHR